MKILRGEVSALPKTMFDGWRTLSHFKLMTVGEIIREIETLPPEDQLKVVRFAYAVREEIVRGFYGSRPDA